ncbi:rCG31966 [Rattus norvegicus]|uniref:RCG31966 n=1 Tax=Rattus norvegicus TaxID=10116 RepID=A6KDW1_RAT|nr:rCG31966 [Rattus norvegicus]
MENIWNELNTLSQHSLITQI